LADDDRRQTLRDVLSIRDPARRQRALQALRAARGPVAGGVLDLIEAALR